MPDIAFTSVAPVRSLDAALQRYRRLGFDPLRTGAVVHLYASDADAVHAEWAASGVQGRFVEPAYTPYELREFTYVEPTARLTGSAPRPAPSPRTSPTPVRPRRSCRTRDGAGP